MRKPNATPAQIADAVGHGIDLLRKTHAVDVIAMVGVFEVMRVQYVSLQLNLQHADDMLKGHMKAQEQEIHIKEMTEEQIQSAVRRGE